MAQQKQVAAAQPTAPADKKEEKKPTTYTKTMMELGPRLPVGIVGGGSLFKDISFKNWTTRQEKELGRLKKPNMNMSQYVSNVLAFMMTQCGSHDWDGNNTKHAERLVNIAQMFMGDVFYAYCWLRREAMGPDIGLGGRCPMCANQLDIVGNLDTLQVVCADDLAALRWSYKLVKPVKIRNQEVTKFTLSVPNWGVMSNVGIENNQSLAKVYVVAGSIVGINDDPATVMLAEAELDDVVKRDLEKMASEINDKFIGPKMVVETACSRCGAEVKAPIKWDYDSFFSDSSR